MGASKFPNDQNTKLIDENGLPISDTNKLPVKVDNGVKIVDAGSGNFVSASNPLDTQLIGTQNKVKLVDDAGTLISDTNGLNVKVNNGVKIIDNSNPANAVEVDADGNMQTEVNNTVATAIPIKITDGVDTADVVDVNGAKCLVVANALGGNPAQSPYTRITDGTEIAQVDATGNLQVSLQNTPTVNIGTMPTVSVNDVGIKTTANTIKIDQVTAGANHIQLADSTNASHVAKVSNNGSVHTVITNDNASAVPTTITGTPSVTLSGTANAVRVLDNGGLPISTSNALPTALSVGGTAVSTSNRFPIQIVGSTAGAVAEITGDQLKVFVANEPRILNQVRISGTTWVDDRRADRYQQSEWNGLTNGSGFTIYNAQLGIYKIRPTQIMISVSNAGIYVFVFDNGSGGTALFLKTRLPANTPHTLTFSNGILSPYTGGTVRVFNNTGGNSDVNTTVQAWEE